jgi:hypothetical protein
MLILKYSFSSYVILEGCVNHPQGKSGLFDVLTLPVSGEVRGER